VKIPNLGHGIGLRVDHYGEILAGQAREKVDWFEIISESFLGPGGRPRAVLRKVLEHHPVVMHGVSMGLGSVDPLNEDYLNKLARLADDVKPVFISDHVCWGGYEGAYAHDLLPLPFTEEAVAHVAERIKRVQDRLGRQMLIENVSSYMAFSHSVLTEWEFLTELCRRADCYLLFDVNNVFVSAHNHNFDARAYIDGIPAERVAQIHLAGHRTRGKLLLDTHDHPVRDEVWSLYERTLKRTGPVSTLVEWDDEIPPLARVIEESEKARARTLAIPKPAPEVDVVSRAPKTHHEGLPLREMEERLWTVVTARESLPEALDVRELPLEYLTDFVSGDEKQDALGRVDIYNGMYFLRILDFIKDDYPALLKILGDDDFYDLIAEFLEAMPNQKPEGKYAGELLPVFVRGWANKNGAPAWWAELARLEWALCDVFDMEDRMSLTGQDVQRIAPERLGDLPLRIVAAHRHLQLAFPVDDVWRSLEKDDVAPEDLPELEAMPTSILVWRNDTRINHRALSADESGLLPDLVRGTTFAHVCETLASGRDETEAAQLAVQLLSRWLQDGLIEQASV
jgi:uncharacterized protein